MKIVITGGAGFIGSKVVEFLHKREDENIEVVIVDNLHPQIHGGDPYNSYLYLQTLGKCRCIVADVCEVEKWGDELVECNVLIHLAAETGTGQSMYELQRYHDVNCSGIIHILEYLSTNEIVLDKILFASSRSVYGEGAYICDKHGRNAHASRDEKLLCNGFFDPHCEICHNTMRPVPTNETDPINPLSFYALTKLYQEKAISYYCTQNNVSYCAFRLQNVYGPGQSLKNPYTGILSIFSGLIIRGQQINIFEDGYESRDFVFVDDVATVFVEAALSNTTFRNEIFNVGCGESVSVLDVVHNLAKCYGKAADFVISNQWRVGDIRHNFADTNKLKTAMELQEFTKFEEGIEKFCGWVSSQPLPDQDYEGSIDRLIERKLLKSKQGD